MIIKYLKNHQNVSILLALFWTIGIIIGCSLPGRDLPSISVFDHFDYKKSNIHIKLIAFSAFFGFAIEFYQLTCVEGRSFDIWDGVADTIGGIIGWLLIGRKK
jgi:glycopeptide antibiotics resistance protein